MGESDGEETASPAGAWLRAVRRSRRISQRELAELAQLPRSSIDRIEAGRVVPKLDTVERLLAVTGYELAVTDQHGRLLALDPERERRRDRARRHFPAHLDQGRTPTYDDGGWWGWERIAWPYTDDWVPEWTYWRRRKARWIGAWEMKYPSEYGPAWDDAT